MRKDEHDMTTTLWLRISSVVSLLFAAGHALGGRASWSPLGETDVLRAMREFRFDVMGSSRTYLDFYLGFGHLLTVSMLLQAVLLWQLASLARADAVRYRPLIASFLLASVVGTVLAWMYVFALPIGFSAVITACLAVAFFLAR
jgi:hypothetical protein